MFGELTAGYCRSGKGFAASHRKWRGADGLAACRAVSVGRIPDAIAPLSLGLSSALFAHRSSHHKKRLPVVNMAGGGSWSGAEFASVEGKPPGPPVAQRRSVAWYAQCRATEIAGEAGS